MRKNKTIAYALAATLLVGGTFLGTKALFTDSDTATNDLVITMGEIGIDVNEDAKWIVKDQNGEVREVAEGKEFTHLKTGDTLVKNITITNTGDLHRKITVEQEGMAPVLPSGVEFVDSSLTEVNDLVVEPNATRKTQLELKVIGNHKHNDQNSLNKDSEVKIDFSKTKYNVNAKQVDQEELTKHDCQLPQN